MSKLRILRWGHDPAISSGPVENTSLYTRMQEELVRGQGKVRMETETEVMGPQAKECQQHSEAEREKKEIPLKSPGEISLLTP